MAFFLRLKRLLIRSSPTALQDPEKTSVSGSVPILTDGTNKPEPFKPDADDEACSKLWKVYIDQAKEYDENLLKEWKQDMEALLIFSALYSASLTAFIIESYKTLQDDPAQNTVNILLQISRQLNGSTTLETPLPFEPPAASLACNIFWFLSLALALTCSLLATFVQQWTRDFIHKTALKPSSVRRARVTAYLHYGLQDFRMHTFVDVIPILLHISLFLFFSGLVAFLLPVNRILTYVMAAVLVVFLAIYFGLTLFPLCYLNSPYRTPMSGVIWRLLNSPSGWLARVHNLVSQHETLTSAILEKSVQKSTERDDRDIKSVIDTIKALTDDEELLPFIEAIPDALHHPPNEHWAPDDPLRQENVKLFIPILESGDSDINVLSRISQFIYKYDQTVPFQKQASLVCPRAVWLLAWASMDTSRRRSRLNPDHVFQYLRFAHGMLSRVATYMIPSDRNSFLPSLGKDMWSALAAVRLSWLYSIRSTTDLLEDLIEANGSSVLNMIPYQEFLYQFSRATEILKAFKFISPPQTVYHIEDVFTSSLQKIIEVLQQGHNFSEGLTQIEEIRSLTLQFKDDETWRYLQFCMLNEYLLGSQSSLEHTGELPFEFDRMCRAIYPPSESLLDFDFFYLKPVSPLLALKSYVAENELNLATDKLMKQHLKFFLSVKEPSSRSEQFAECRQFVQWYIVKRNDNQKQFRFDNFDKEDFSHIGQCIIEYMPLLGDDVEQSTMSLEAAFILLRNPRYLGRLFKGKTDFFPKLFVYLGDARFDLAFKSLEGYILFKTLLDLVVGVRLALTDDPDSDCLPESIKDRIEASLYQDYLLPRFILLESISCRYTLVVAILSRYLDLSCEPRTPLDCRGILRRLPLWGPGAAPIHESIQLMFVNNVSKLVNIVADGGLEAENLVLTLYDVFSCARSTHWITSRQSATILYDVILRYRSLGKVSVSDTYKELKEIGEWEIDNLLALCQELL
ncbi:hypothetical protein VKT23_002541 [Stygiomarasmius scandens]|uniref:DUF6535 domain-containing protein n=1 Tax=Marasmiellus scandens TaxID=2682957 RepID=A0ABR1K3L8_9AGAR